MIKLASVYELVLSSGAMKFNCSSKLVTLLLLAALLLTSMGTLGYAWCVGDDGHVEVSFTSGRGCCDEDQSQEFFSQYNSTSITRASGDSCGLCLDFDAQQYEAVFVKRIKRFSTVPPESLSPGNPLPSLTQSRYPVVDHILPLPSPRVAQTLLVHRTIVLLN